MFVSDVCLCFCVLSLTVLFLCVWFFSLSLLLVLFIDFVLNYICVLNQLVVMSYGVL